VEDKEGCLLPLLKMQLQVVRARTLPNPAEANTTASITKADGIEIRPISDSMINREFLLANLLKFPPYHSPRVGNKLPFFVSEHTKI
jgi:hypothetical protein